MGWDDDPTVEDFGRDDEVVESPKAKGFLDDHPNVKTAIQVGIPIAAGLAAMPFTGGLSLPAAVLAEGGIQGLTELGLQATGVNEKSLTNAGLSAAFPGVARSAAGVLANVPKYLPGFGEAARAAVTPEMRAMPGKLLPGDSKALYDQLGKQTGPNVRITSFPELSKAIKDADTRIADVPWGKLQEKLRMNGQSELFDQIKQSIQGVAPTVGMTKPTVGGKPFTLPGFPATMQVTNQGRPPGLNFDEARSAVESLGNVIRSTSDDAERGVYKNIYKAMLSDLEKAPMPASGDLALWKQARQVYKTERARYALQEATEKAIKTKDGVDIVDPNQIVKWLRTNDDIKSRVSESEFRDIMNTYRGMSSVVGHNLGKFWGMILGSAAGATVGGIMGGPVGSLAGMSAGTAGYAASEGLARAMMSESGRKWVRIMMSNPTESNFRKGASLLGVGAGNLLKSNSEE